MKENKRLFVLLGILALVVLVFLFRMFGSGGGNSGFPLPGSSKAEVKNEQKREKLKTKNLEASNYSLRSIGQNPFDNPLLAKPEPQKPAPQVNIPDKIPVNPPSMSREEPPKPVAPPSGKNDTKNGMRLKALAKAGDRKIAVIEQGNKSVSAFVGSAVGSYIVTDISDNQVTLQNFNGTSVTLDLVS